MILFEDLDLSLRLRARVALRGGLVQPSDHAGNVDGARAAGSLLVERKQNGAILRRRIESARGVAQVMF